jgi:hypothetical protein
LAKSDNLCVRKSDGTPLCITGDQLAAVLASQQISNPTPPTISGTSTPPSPSAGDASNTPPVIHINGTNPAIIKVGDTYGDLGATITGPTADLNLDIRTFVNSVAVNSMQIDTSTVATDTIDYVATDQTGLASTSTRTVIVRAPDSAPSPTEVVINPNVATTSPSAAATSTTQ